jgi:hypothetical protein
MVYLNMKIHKGMRPHDVAVLLKIIAFGDKDWLGKDIANELILSKSAVCESLARSTYAGLLAKDKRTVNREALYGFLVDGLKYVFPIQAGTVALGLATASVAPILRDYFPMEEVYVWPAVSGETRGLLIEPLYPGAVNASKLDPILYDLLAICDVIRIGKPKEVKKATELLRNIFGHSEDYISC